MNPSVPLMTKGGKNQAMYCDQLWNQSFLYSLLSPVAPQRRSLTPSLTKVVHRNLLLLNTPKSIERARVGFWFVSCPHPFWPAILSGQWKAEYVERKYELFCAIIYLIYRKITSHLAVGCCHKVRTDFFFLMSIYQEHLLLRDTRFYAAIGGQSH